MYEFWLKDEANNILMQLPVSLPEYEYEYANEIETIKTTGFGDINIVGNKRLNTIKLSGFFPFNDYDFSKASKLPVEYVDQIKKWIDNKAIIRLIITDGTYTKVNQNNVIESITPSENGESNGDINYVITLREYRKPEAKSVVLTTVTENRTRETVKAGPKAKTYTVASGDYLTKIARKLYGDASKWNVIYEANKAIIGKNENLIKVGQVLTIP